MTSIPTHVFFRVLRSFVVTTALAGTPVCAQDITSEIDKIFQWATPTTPGCVCAVSQHGKVIVNRAYGSADLERDVLLSPQSILDAGSVVKQFVAASVLLLVEDGQLSLTEDIRTYIPELPDTGHTITLDHLLTHTSGVRDWTGMRPLATGDPDALTLTLRQRGLNFAPGEEWSYSNSGYVLLKEIVARVSGMSFSDFTQQRLFDPLQMTSTTYLLDMTDVVKHRALAYKKEGERWKLDMYFGNDRGGGGALMTTASDLVLWNDALTSSRLGPFVTEKLHEPATLNNGRKLGYARGLQLDTRRGGKLVWHSGGAAGYSTIVARLPEQGLSVAIMCNADGGARSAFTSRIFDVLLPETVGASAPDADAPADGERVDVAPSDLKGKAGLFFNEGTGQPLRVALNNDTLVIAGGGPLVALGNDRFRNRRSSLSFMSQADVELQYLASDEFEIKTKEGATTRYRRAQPYAPTVAELQAFAGRFESDEIGAVFEMTSEDDVLRARANDAPGAGLEFAPVDRDTFQLGGVTLRFLRDEGQRVTGFDFSNPVVRNIRFTRLSGP